MSSFEVLPFKNWRTVVQYYIGYRCTVMYMYKIVAIFKSNSPFVVVIKYLLYSPCSTVYLFSLFYM